MLEVLEENLKSRTKLTMKNVCVCWGGLCVGWVVGWVVRSTGGNGNVRDIKH